MRKELLEGPQDAASIEGAAATRRKIKSNRGPFAAVETVGSQTEHNKEKEDKHGNRLSVSECGYGEIGFLGQ